MSSKKFMYLLMMVAIVCGFVVAGDTAHGQSIGIYDVQGIVMESDGTPAAGLIVTGDRLGVDDTPAESDATGTDGSYKLLFQDFPFGEVAGGGPKIQAGEQIAMTVTDPNDNNAVVGRAVHTVIDALNPNFTSVTFNITLSGISVETDPDELPADGSSTAEITVTITGANNTGDTVTIDAPTEGRVSDVQEVGGGVYTATYTAPLDLALSFPRTITLAVSATAGTVNAYITLIEVPTKVSVALGQSAFIAADAPEDTAVTVTVTAENVGPVTDENITLSVSGAGANLGTVTATATNNGDGTYSATYTSGTTAGNVTLTATATGSGASGTADIVINAGPPANIELSAAHDTVVSLSSTTITAEVTDSTGNPAGATLASTTTSGGEVGDFTSTVFGTYTATYSAPTIDVGVEMVETVTVSTDGISDSLTLNLLGEEPIPVGELVVRGTVFKEDGEVSAANVTVTIEAGSNSDAKTTNADGSYAVAFLGFGNTVATTGDTVSVDVGGANVVGLTVNGVSMSGDSFILRNAVLEKVAAGEPVIVDVTTDIVIPPRSVDSLTVKGTVFKEDKTTPVGPGIRVEITVGSNSDTKMTGADGSYSAAFLGFGSAVATSGDPVLIVASDDKGERGRDNVAVKNIELPEAGGHADIVRDVNTNIGLTAVSFSVVGTVYLKNGDTPVAASSDMRDGDLTVVVTNKTRGNLEEKELLGDNGKYGLAFFNPFAAVAETGDEITVEVKDEAGEPVGSKDYTLTIADLQTERVEINIDTTVPAEVGVLHIVGNVIEIGGSPAPAGLPVTIRLDMHGTTVQEIATTEADGSYKYVFFNLITPVAATGDVLTVDVLRASDQFRGHSGPIPLTSAMLLPTSQPLVVADITLVPPKLDLGGLSINTHYTGIQDPAIQQMLSMDLVGLATRGADMADPSGELSGMLPPSLPLLLSPIFAAIGAFELELPEGFGGKNIAMESFGNAITTRPTAWAAFPAAERTPGRWINGNQLNLYISGAPTIDGVTFTLNGVDQLGTSVPASGFSYTFQLEEEMIALFSGDMQVFDAVMLMVDDGAVPMTRGAGGVWSADVMLTPGSDVSYYYLIELATPYVDPLGGLTIKTFPFIDPLNRQLKTDGLSQAIEGLLTSELGALDPGVRSVFSVPAVNSQQSLWVTKFDLAADGMHQLDVNVTYRGSNHEDNITGQTLMVDRTAPSSGVTLATGHNAGMYERPDGTYVATGPTPGEASLTVTPTTPLSEAGAYMIQLARLDALGDPGAWNPVVTSDLLPLDLVKLLSETASVLPLSIGNPVDVLFRNAQGGGLLGTYGLRAVGIDSLLNMDSARPVDLTVEFVTPDPDIAEVTYVTSDFDGNNVIEGLEMQSAAGDVVVYSNSLVTLTVEVMERTDHPLASIALEYQIPGSGWLPIDGFGPEQLVGVGFGDSMEVPLPVPDIPGLPDRGAQVMLRTVTTNALNVVNEHVVMAAYERRLPPNVSAIYADVTDRNPDSGAAQGLITVSAFTQAMTDPGTTAVQLDIRRTADAEWMLLGIVQIANSKVVSPVNLAIIEGQINAIVNGSPSSPILSLYREWPLTIDSATLEDTILDDTDAASDASLDDNPYVLRAIAVDTAFDRYESADGKGFSLDNYSPTAIITVANEVEMVAPRADESYYVSGLIHESVPDPMLTLTARTGAHPNAFVGGMALAVNDASGTAMEIPATAFTPAGNYNHTGVFNLASIPNGTYTFRAVAHAVDGSPEERIVAMEITVEVGNFTPPENFADPTVDILSVINTRGDARSPSEIDAEYTVGFPAIEDKVNATLMVPNVSAGDLDVLVGDDQMSAGAGGILMVMQMEGSIDNAIMVDTAGLEEGMHGLVGVVSKPNGSIQFALPSIRVDRTGPEIVIVSPVERHQVTTLPTIHVTFNDATGFDVTDTDPRHVTISLSRLADEAEIDVTETLIRLTAAADGEILTRSGDIAYTHDDPVVGGAYRIGVTVMDVLGNESVAAPVEFTVEGVQPTVSIVSPIAGRIIDPRQPLIVSVALTGNGDITVSEFQINGNDLEGTLENNWLTYTMQPPLVGEEGSVLQRGSDNTISVKIVDSEGRTADGSTDFAVSLDNTPPVISGPSPKGDITRKIGRITALVTDNESDITRIQYALDDSPLTDISFSPARVYEVGGGKEVKGQTSFNLFDAPLGTHTVTIVAESTGGTTTLNWEFTIVHPDQKPPEVVTYSPLGIIRTDRPVLAATVSDESGFARDGITLILAGVPGNQGSGRRSSPTSTTVTFTPSIAVTPGPYTARLTVVDKYNNRTEAEWQFTVELDETPPSITTTSPHGVIHLDKPIITVSASDDRSGVDGIAITAKDGGGLPVNGVTDVRSDKTAATFTPTQTLKDGVYTVDVKVADKSGNEASARWQFTVELDLIPPSVLITRPTQEHTENRRPVISASYTDNMSGVDADSIKLTLDGSTVTPDEVSETQVVFTPGYDLPFGQHTVALELSDTAPKANSTVHEWTFFVERIGIADARNYPNPFDDDTTIAFRISRQAKITVQIYDFTGRLVATPVSNSLREAGVVEIDWHGETSGNDHLSRGVYFCHILMESELEPQSAILKMAIIRD
jgi:hypothetical protein